MAQTEHYGLPLVTSAEESTMKFQDWRRSINGDDADSALNRIDSAIRTAEDNAKAASRPATWTPSAAEVGAIPVSQKGAKSGVASLDASGKVPAAQLPAMDYDPAGSADTALTDAKTYTDEQIAAIPTPDVSGQIATHNSSATAHSDIRTKLSGKADAATLTAHTGNRSNPHGVTAVQIGAVKTDLSNVSDAAFADKAAEAGAGGVPVATTAGAASAYTAAVRGVTELYPGLLVTIIPHVASSGTVVTLDVNGLGAHYIARDYSNTSEGGGTLPNGFLCADKPVLLRYSGNFWQIVGAVQPAAEDLLGFVPVASGGTGATTAEQARTNLGAAAASHTHTPAQVGGIPIVTTYTPKGGEDGYDYAVDVDGIEKPFAGMLLMIKPHVNSTSTEPTITVNGQGPYPIRRPGSQNNATPVRLASDNWMTVNPVLLMYGGYYWFTVTNPGINPEHLAGTVPVKKGGTGLTTIPAGSYLVGNGTGALQTKTPAQVRADIGAIGTTDAYTKAEALTAATAGLYGLGVEAVPDEVLGKLGKSVGLTETDVKTKSILQDWNRTEYSHHMSVDSKRMAYGNGIFVAVNYASGTPAVIYSTDGGKSWMIGDLGGTGGYWSCVAFGNEIFVTVRSNYGEVRYSTSGKDWEYVDIGGTAQWEGMTYGAGRFVMVGSGIVKHSTDGKIWKNGDGTNLSGAYGVAFGNGKFVAICRNSNRAAYSTDGITWTAVTLPVSGYWESIVFGGGKFLSNYGGTTVYSTDGINWVQGKCPVDGRYGMAYGNGQFACVSGEKFAYSTDGINWGTYTLPVDFGATAGLCFGEDVFVCKTVSNGIYYSEDVWETLYRLQSVNDLDVTDHVASALGSVKVATGSYVGTGTYGTSNPNSLTFAFDPKMIVVASEYDRIGFFVRGSRTSVNIVPSVIRDNDVFWDGNKVSWYRNVSENTAVSIDVQLNNEGETYYYIAFG